MNSEVLKPKKPTSVFYAKEELRAKNFRWPTPQGGAFAFFTSWNALAATFTTILVLIAVPIMRIWSTSQKIAAFSIVPLSIAVMASIVCTMIISQLLFAYNIEIERGPNEPDEHKGKKLALGVDFVQSMLNYNFIFHIGPLILAVVIGLALSFLPGPSTIMGRASVFVTTFTFFTIFVLAWLLTPIKVTHEEGEEPETVMGWQKIEFVYRNPDKKYFTIVFPIVAILTMVLATWCIYGASTPLGFRGF